jgi:hypothetical protein
VVVDVGVYCYHPEGKGDPVSTKKTIYVKDADLQLWERFEEAVTAGQRAESVSSMIADAMRGYLDQYPRQGLLRIGEYIERLIPLIDEVPGSSPYQQRWRSATALLRNELTAFPDDMLKSCRQLTEEVGRRVDEKSIAMDARNEVTEALRALGPEM